MIVEVVVLALVAYRLWRLIGRDTITEGFRSRLSGWLLELVTCPWCLGTWIALALAVVGSLLGYVASDWLVVGLAAATLVGLLSVFDR